MYAAFRRLLCPVSPREINRLRQCLRLLIGKPHYVFTSRDPSEACRAGLGSILVLGLVRDLLAVLGIINSPFYRCNGRARCLYSLIHSVFFLAPFYRVYAYLGED